MPKKTSWHEMAKEALKEIGKEWGYSVSESEKELFFASKFRLFNHQISGKGWEIIREGATERKPYTLSYKPDVVWKKEHNYRAIFEIEYLPQRKSAMEKRKYAIGSLMLAYLAMVEKSVKSLVFLTNNQNLYREILTFKRIIPLEYEAFTHTLCVKASNLPNIKKGLNELLSAMLKK